MEVYLLTEVTYDFYAFPEVYGVFSSVENAREFIKSLIHEHNLEYPIYVFTDEIVNDESILREIAKKQMPHWEITKYSLNEGIIYDDSSWDIKAIFAFASN